MAHRCDLKKFPVRFFVLQCGKYLLFIKKVVNLPQINQGIVTKIMDEKQIIARNIKRMREISGYTQENVASFLGINRSAYSNYELGFREMPIEYMEKLADLYGCDAYILYEEDIDVLDNMLATAFRVDNLLSEDMEHIAAFKRVVKNSLIMDLMLSK